MGKRGTLAIEEGANLKRCYGTARKASEAACRHTMYRSIGFFGMLKFDVKNYAIC
jgi:hypothetical protein